MSAAALLALLLRRWLREESARRLFRGRAFDQRLSDSRLSCRRPPSPPPPPTTTTQPDRTLYVNNLHYKVKKAKLLPRLFTLFTTYGRILDVVAFKPKVKD